ncbi:MAG TPA: DUF6600 domain-containing protein, partial [Verrucomicrobiae bacterium]|nr:DUF6600 domain-containing protein [Verrucomicrobiae bacterium]
PPSGSPATPPSGAPVATTPPPGVPPAGTVPNAQVIGAPPVVQSGPVMSADASYFQNDLSPYGRWFVAEDGQWYWQPAVALSSPGWQPYWDAGHWVSTDQGWYWASDYPWGEVAFHYGRWHLHPRYGWVWFPERTWAPAWVVWRSGGEYCGWAPLPPGAVFDTVNGGFLWRGGHVGVDFDFGLGWNHFNFCYVREMGDRPIRHWRGDEVRVVFGHTAVLNTFATVRVGVGIGASVRIVNRGIEPARVERFRGRPVETVKVETVRTTTVGGHGREVKTTTTRTVETGRREHDRR